MPMTPALLDAIARDRAAQPVDPRTLTDAEKNAKILALQARGEEMQGIATFLANLLQSVERATLSAGADDRTYRRLILDLCHRRWECATPATIVERETGAESFARRAV
jgi:hypothetical protein